MDNNFSYECRGAGSSCILALFTIKQNRQSTMGILGAYFIGWGALPHRARRAQSARPARPCPGVIHSFRTWRPPPALSAPRTKLAQVLHYDTVTGNTGGGDISSRTQAPGPDLAAHDLPACAHAPSSARTRD
jgi:hypothetical protein